MENRFILVSGIAAIKKRWCCPSCYLYNLYISKELERGILKLRIRAFFFFNGRNHSQLY